MSVSTVIPDGWFVWKFNLGMARNEALRKTKLYGRLVLLYATDDGIVDIFATLESLEDRKTYNTQFQDKVDQLVNRIIANGRSQAVNMDFPFLVEGYEENPHKTVYKPKMTLQYAQLRDSGTQEQWKYLVNKFGRWLKAVSWGRLVGQEGSVSLRTSLQTTHDKILMDSLPKVWTPPKKNISDQEGSSHGSNKRYELAAAAAHNGNDDAGAVPVRPNQIASLAPLDITEVSLDNDKEQEEISVVSTFSPPRSHANQSS